MRSAYIGFDSAWSGKAPGGLCYAILDSDSLCDCATPVLATFDDAKGLIEQCREDTDYTLVAIDQPTMVPNHTGMRPVEKVAGSVQPGVQPANLNSSMFNRSAPIWAFLDDLNPKEEPLEAQQATKGLHLIEVFPGLALRGLLPNPPKKLRYNPKGSSFSIDDWRSVAECTSAHAKELGLAGFARWAAEQSGISAPSKADQDRLDALICLVVAGKWHRGDTDTAVLGDWRGYMVTPLSRQGKMKVTTAAKKHNVPIGTGSWRVYEAVLAYFDGKHYDAFEWLGHPSAALGGETPLERAKTPEGTQDVLDLIGRLEHGIPT